MWDHASDMEIAILEHHFDRAGDALGRLLAASPTTNELRSAGESVQRLRLAWEARGMDTASILPIEQRLLRDTGAPSS
jgi:hypothetical protein